MDYIFSDRPRLVYYEATQACSLACAHCRAEASPQPHPFELDQAAAEQLIDSIAGFGQPLPHLVFTGGDPLSRPDLFELIDYARSKGIAVSVTPAGTPSLTSQVVEKLARSGVSSLGLSLDGSTASRHDRFRGVDGSYYWTSRAARVAASIGLPVQINTMVTRDSVEDLPAIHSLLDELEPARWALFFLVPVGRGVDVSAIDAKEAEAVLNWVVTKAGESRFPIKTTEAHHVRRIATTRMRTRGLSNEQIAASPIGRGFGIRDGNGIVFVSHVGAVYPSGFLPLAAGNIRSASLTHLYRDSQLFQDLRDPDRLKGKCGRCEFRRICGGSRARAFAVTGDPLASDPLCIYEPSGLLPVI